MHDNILPNLIARFRELATQAPSPCPWAIRLIGTYARAFHTVIGTCIHGTETGSLPAVVKFAEDFLQGKLNLLGTWTLVLGNPEAVQKQVRFVEEDLNRVFFPAPTPPQSSQQTIEQACQQPKLSLERKRALEILPLLADCSLFLDFHQTMRPCAQPFYIFGFHQLSYYWARILQGSTVLVTRDPQKPFAEGQMCGDEYCRSLGYPAVTLELGEKGICQQAYDLTLKVLNNLHQEICLLVGDSKNQLGSKKIPAPSGVEVNQEANPATPNNNLYTNYLMQRSTFFRELDFYETVHKEPFFHPSQILHEGCYNFKNVTKDEVIGEIHGQPLRAPCNGALLFPKYPKRTPQGQLADPITGDLFHIVSKLLAHPADQGWATQSSRPS